MGCLYLFAICVLGIVIMVTAISVFGTSVGLAISTFADLVLLGGWLLYLWREDRKLAAEETDPGD